MTVEALWELRGQRLEESIREQCRDRLTTAFVACDVLDPSISKEADLVAESRRLLASDGCSDGRIGKLTFRAAQLKRARESLRRRQQRISQAASGLTADGRHRRIASLLVEATLSADDADADTQAVVRQLERRPALGRLLDMCADIQPHHERRVLWQGMRNLVLPEDVPMLKRLLDDPRVVVRTQVVVKDRKAFDEPVLYFPVRDAVQQCLVALDLTADVVTGMPLDSDEARRHVQMLSERSPSTFDQLRPALRATGLERYRTLLLPRP